MPSKIAILFAASLFVLSGSACGYLDDDLFVDDAVFAQSLDLESMTIRGYGYGSGSVHASGCGFGIHGHSVGSSRSVAAPHSRSAALAKPLAQMSDVEVLEHTDVEIISESEASGDDASAQPGAVEYIYRAQMAERDEAVLGVYASP